MQYVAFHGVPRSGTTWVGSIFDSSENVAYRHQPLFSYAFKSYLDEFSKKERINSFFEKLLDSKDSFILQDKEKMMGIIPTFKKEKITHIVYKEARYHHILENMLYQHDSLLLVVIIRNPKSVISSWYNAPKEFDKNKWQLEEEWLHAQKKNKNRKEEFYGYIKWKETAIMFLRLKDMFPNRIHILKYSDLLANTEIEIQKLFQFCSICYGNQTEDFIRKCSSMDGSWNAYSVYRINQTDIKWKEHLSEEIVDYINKDLLESNLSIFNND